jgi:tetratricopeptide (TPR) repeat protein
MSTSGRLQKVFEGMLSSQSFELLNNFSRDDSWSTLLPEEKEVLAQLFLLNAETHAVASSNPHEKNEALRNFRSACRIAPLSARVWYRLGAFLALEESVEDLGEAEDALRRAVTLDSGFFDAQYSLASVVLRLGVLKEDSERLYHAQEVFAQAAVRFENNTGFTIPGEFYWHWGICWFLLGRNSGEPADLQKAIGCYTTAYTTVKKAEFLNDYANALVELSLQICSLAHIEAAVLLYRESIDSTEDRKSQDLAVRYFNLGCCFQHLFEAAPSLTHFQEADDSFGQAARIFPNLRHLWVRWGLFLYKASRCFDDIELAERALEKLSIAEQYEYSQPLVFATQSLIHSWIGLQKDDVHQLECAKLYAQKGSEVSQGILIPEVSAAIATCQTAFGIYFQSSTYFELSSKILQQALADHPRSAILWFALAECRSALGRISETLSPLREALVCFVLASKSQYACMPILWFAWGKTLLDLADATGDESCATEAVLKLEKSIELLGETRPSWIQCLASAYELLGDLSDDESWYERAIQVLTDICADENSCMIRSQIGTCHLRIGELIEDTEQIDRAISLFELVLAEDPENSQTWGEYGLAYVHKSQNNAGVHSSTYLLRAEEAFLKASSLGDHFSDYHLACVYSLLGNFPEALNFLRKAFHRRALPPLHDIVEDDWLQPLATTAQFQKFLADLEADEDFEKETS